jgi:hypothetical protein
VEKKKGMDFSNRNSQPQTVAPSAHPAAPSPVNPGNRKVAKPVDKSKGLRAISGVLLVAVVVLVVALVAFISFGTTTDEDKFVDTNKLQAVFLNTGQVYFGNIKDLNSKYYVLTNIYYLQTSSSGTSTSTSSANTSVSLVKLGCELHAPYDQMVINSDEVTFWENLQPTGQVAKAVATFQKENPAGQKCSDQSAATSGTSSANGVQGTGTTSTTTPTTSTTTTPVTTTPTKP